MSLNNFGNVAFSQNLNLETSGYNNSGIIESNLNLVLLVTNCILSINGNSNGKVNSNNSDINCSKCFNTVLNGDGNQLKIEKSKNFKFNGVSNFISCKHSTNIEIYANKSVIDFHNVKNGKAILKNVSVIVERSSNIKINSDGGNISIKDACNHHIKRSSLEEAETKIEILPGHQTCHAKATSKHHVGFFSDLDPANENLVIKGNVNVDLTFRNTVEIEGNSYKIDNFEFTLIQKSGSQFDVKFLLDEDSMKTNRIGVSEVHIFGTRNGKEEFMKFVAPVIDIIGSEKQNVFTVDMDLDEDCDI